jgi:integrase
MNEFKRYIKYRLISTDHFAWSTALQYTGTISRFLNFISEIEPTWNDLSKLSRQHILKYLEHLNAHAHSLKIKRTNPEYHISQALILVQKFLEDTQRYDYKIAPIKPIKTLIYKEDKPKLKKRSHEQIDHIPEIVLEQLFSCLGQLDKIIQATILVAFKTGLRISDVLGLTQDCLVKLNGKYQLVTDIEKTYVVGHTIPIDEDLALIVSSFIEQSINNSNDQINPNKFIFINFEGKKRGKVLTRDRIATELNILARENNIVDESGRIWHFATHQFRHTFAVKMINSGADLITVQELLAHSSPEMTLRYAKLLDSTKRKAFEEALKQGVFSFDYNGKVQEIRPEEDVPSEILEMLWQDHKLNAIDNPYGTCHARINGNCPYSEEPPCLTCNGGSPCKDLAIGFSDLDKQKYEILVKSTLKTIEAQERRGRDDIATKNKNNLERYKNILTTIEGGNVIFGRLDRLKKRKG